MSSNNSGDWKTPVLRQRVILNIEEALKKSSNLIGSPNEKSAAEIEDQIFSRSGSRDAYLTMVARIILHLQSGGQNLQQQQQQQASTNQVPGNPMMITSNISQTGQLKFNEHNVPQTDTHHISKLLPQPSPLNGISTPSPKIPLHHSPSPLSSHQSAKQSKVQNAWPVQVTSTSAYPSPSPVIPSPSPISHSPAAASSPAQISAQSPSSLLASKISGIPSVESPGSFNPPSNLNLGSQESPGRTDLSDKEEQQYMEKLKQLSVYTEPLRKMIAKMQSDEDVANKESKNLTKLKRLLSILGNPKKG
ncbi:mediator of RNA polymerase II transcription subunit 15-like [Xenia sp. Carnegie-2017]|uniref:mediator of RNA polymerase II transcription subunit 15-like n=1 Tax=Xenia sp. Carnegie-2017 TaxID=2897299 RepID=UPI001F04EE15|nr:mediator of RNA polymerase II transcription subunit 15-like [Xenia sp. Carnegie-2017]